MTTSPSAFWPTPLRPANQRDPDPKPGLEETFWSISQALTRRVKELAERCETPLPLASKKVAELEAKVNAHLERMGFTL